MWKVIFPPELKEPLVNHHSTELLHQSTEMKNSTFAAVDTITYILIRIYLFF